jgi:hypothetical protein
MKSYGYEILPKDSANEYSMLSIDWKRLFSCIINNYIKFSLLLKQLSSIIKK